MDNLGSVFQNLNNLTVITPNRRLAATLHKLYTKHQIDQGIHCWPTPDILPITTWVQRLWQEDSSKSNNGHPILLSTTQESFLWESIINSSKDSLQLLQVSETAELAKSAWSVLKQWLVNIHQPIFKSSEEYSALEAWAAAFEKMNKKNNWIDSASLTDLVIEKIKLGKIVPTKEIILFGFTELSPQLKQLVILYTDNELFIDETSARGGAGSSISRAACEHENDDPVTGPRARESSKIFGGLRHCVPNPPYEREICSQVRISLADTDDEILTIARWAKATLNKNNSARIGCVIPTLDKIRDRVMQIFTEVFYNNFSGLPRSAKNAELAMTGIFNISAGKPLLQCPIIYTALQLLGLNKKTISLDIFSSLLLSPFLGSAESERIRRANLDSQLRKENVTSINLLHKSFSQQCPRLDKKIQAFLHMLDEAPKEQSYYEWAKLFSELLATLGWPGERSLNSEEYQIVEHWLRLLDEFSTLDQITKPTNIYQAIQTLKKMAVNSIFQPKTPEAPVQILGLLEAAGLPFNYLWVAGMDDISWPPAPKPNPLIPKRLQRELNMPHATAERELIYCQQLMQQFKENAQEIIFSHVMKNDELELLPSPLIRDIQEISIHELDLVFHQSSAEKIFLSKLLETIIDETAPAHQGNEVIRGGVNVIKQQALCPFKAFAEMRLHACELENPLPGFRAKDRGSILHKALEYIWNKLNDHSTLCQHDESSLTSVINSSINEALKLFSNTYNEKPQYLLLEKKRLFKLLWDWLQIEKQRLPFKVLNNEKSTQITLNHLNLTVRIDRIDELEDGKKLIIDYKTGKNNDINAWFGDRPEEPQLPLYSLLDIDNTVGITFAQVFPGKNCFKGISRYSLDIQGIMTECKKMNTISWDEQISSWKNTFIKLSDDFYFGTAKVNPKNTDTCEWCMLKPLCRIKEEITQHEE